MEDHDDDDEESEILNDPHMYSPAKFTPAPQTVIGDTKHGWHDENEHDKASEPHEEDQDDEFNHHIANAPKVFSQWKYKEFLEHQHTLSKKCCGHRQRAADDQDSTTKNKRCCGGMRYERDEESGQLRFTRDTPSASADITRPQRCCNGK